MEKNYERTQEEMFDIIMDTIRKYTVREENMERELGIDPVEGGLNGFDFLPYMLEQFPEFDVNYTVENKPIDMYYWEHMEDTHEYVETENNERRLQQKSDRWPIMLPAEEPGGKLIFSGRLIHYAILKNDMDAVNYLLSKGSVLLDKDDEEDYSKKYVNSVDMNKFLNSTEQYLRSSGKR